MAETSFWQRLGATFRLKHNYDIKPLGFKWRSNTFFILATVGIGLFSDLFLYSIIVPVMPFLLQDHIGLPYAKVQSNLSALLAVYAAASVVICPIAGLISDRMGSRQIPFLAGLLALIISTILLLLGTTMSVVVIARIFQGASSAFVWTVGMTLAMDTVGPANLGKTIGSVRLSVCFSCLILGLFSFCSIGELFAPVIGGALYKHSGANSVLALCLAVLVIDFLMRLMMIEKKTAAQFDAVEQENRSHESTGASQNESTDAEDPGETSALLPNGTTKPPDDEVDDTYLIPPDQPALFRTAPLLYPLTHSSALAAAFFLTFTQASLLSSYDATVPTHAYELYGFDSLKVGILFIPLSLVSLVIGPLGGWAVDRYGTKFGAVVGYIWLVPALVLLRLPKAHPYPQQVILWAGLLAIVGVGTSFSGSPGIVEAGIVLEKYYKRNPKFFGPNGPYAQLYGMVSVFFNLGCAVSPEVAGTLKDRIGYGNMNIVMAALAGFTGIVSFFYLGGGPPKLWRKKE